MAELVKPAREFQGRRFNEREWSESSESSRACISVCLVSNLTSFTLQTKRVHRFFQTLFKCFTSEFLGIQVIYLNRFVYLVQYVCCDYASNRILIVCVFTCLYLRMVVACFNFISLCFSFDARKHFLYVFSFFSNN